MVTEDGFERGWAIEDAAMHTPNFVKEPTRYVDHRKRIPMLALSQTSAETRQYLRMKGEDSSA